MNSQDHVYSSAELANLIERFLRYDSYQEQRFSRNEKGAHVISVPAFSFISRQKEAYTAPCSALWPMRPTRLIFTRFLIKDAIL